MKRVLDLPQQASKVAVPGALAAHRETLVTDGNHLVSRYNAQVPVMLLEHCELAQFPIRSVDQLAAKCLISHVRWRARSDYATTAADHHIAGAQLLAGEPGFALTDPDRLLAAYVPELSWGTQLRPFTVHGVCRYPHLARVYPYRRILASLDVLADRSRVTARAVTAHRQKAARGEPLSQRIFTAARRMHRFFQRCLPTLRLR
jgi:hypothetical protein